MSKLRTRLVLMSLIGVIPALAAILYTQWSERDRARARTLDDNLRLTRLAANQQARVFDGAHRLLMTLAQFPALRDEKPESCSALLVKVLHEHKDISLLTVFDVKGERVCGSSPVVMGAAAHDRAWFQRVIRTKAAAVGDYQIGRGSGKPDVIVAQPLLDAGGEVGRILIAAVDVETLTRLVEGLMLPPGTTLTVFDRNRTILAHHPDSAQWRGRQVSDSPLMRRTLDGESGMDEMVGVDGIRRLYVNRPVVGGIATGLYVGMGLERSVAYGAADRMLRRDLWQLGLILLLTIGTAVVGSELFVLRPVGALIAVTTGVARGDLGTRARLGGGIREIGELGDAFNAMAAVLEARQQERDRAEGQLRESEERYRVPFEHAPHPCWVYDLDTLAFIEVNRAACQHYGYTRDEFLTMTVKDIRPPEEVPDLLKGVRRMIEEGTAAPPSRWIHRKKDGTPITVEISSMIVTIAGRRCAIALAHDVSERAQLEHQLRHSQKMEAVGQLAGGVAHDFNNMLTAINGYSEIVLDALGDAHPMTPAVKEIEKAGVRAAGLTRQLLAFSRKQLLSPAVLDPNAVVGGVDTLLRRLIGEHIELRITRRTDLGAVKADPNQLEQVLLNLAVNARDAMPDGGILTIETRAVDLDESFARVHPDVPAGRYVVISVSDTGVGMDETVAARIFEPFFTTKSAAEGTGLGLSVVYGIIRQSGGHVCVRTQPGHGSTFDVYLPRVDETPVSSVKRERRSAVGGSETILVAEDEDSVRGLVRATLKSGGYSVIEARNGAEALALYQARVGSVHLLVTDVVMPKMNGLELAQRLSAEHPGLKVLCMSGYAADTTTHGPVVWPFLAKPFVPASLLERVREVLDA